jgi:hypothetical protein
VSKEVLPVRVRRDGSFAFPLGDHRPDPVAG